MIIAIEGIDGAGKNTLASAVRSTLGADALAFPRYGESVHADLVSEALHGQMGDLTDSAYAMATLFALDRAGAKDQIAEYAGDADRILVLDRYVASNAAYSAARTGDAGIIEWVRALEFDRFGLPVPDLHVLVDTSPAEAHKRAAAREAADASRTRDRYERDAGLQQATFDAYSQLADTHWVSRWVRATEPATIIQAIEEYSSRRLREQR